MTDSIGYGPPLAIDGPPPLAPRLGLLPAADSPLAAVRIVPGDDRWLNGVQVYPYDPGVGGAWNACASGSNGGSKAAGDGPELPEFGPITAYVPEACSTFSVRDQQAYRARALAVLSAVESGIVAHEFMTGEAQPSLPYLADGQGTFPLGDTPASIIDALAEMEHVIGLTRRQGVIHLSPSIAARAPLLIDYDNGVLRTVNGTTVIADAGYSEGSTPAGHAAPTARREWIYATGPIDIRRSEMFVIPDRVEQAVDRLTNRVAYIAERYYLVDWDTQLQAAILVDPCKKACE